MLDGMPGVKVKDQFERRRNWRAKDEFGRLWESTVDTESGGTCAPINPKGWNDRLNMPQKYLIKALSSDPETGNLGIRIIPALQLWADDLEKAHASYDQQLYNDALMLFGAEGPKAYEDRAPALVSYTGPAPQAIEPVLAAIEGYEWALGISDDDPLDMGQYFPRHETKREKFLRELKEKRGLDLDALEEHHDPGATGGKRQKVGKKITA